MVVNFRGLFLHHIMNNYHRPVTIISHSISSSDTHFQVTLLSPMTHHSLPHHEPHWTVLLFFTPPCVTTARCPCHFTDSNAISSTAKPVQHWIHCLLLQQCMPVPQHRLTAHVHLLSTQKSSLRYHQYNHQSPITLHSSNDIIGNKINIVQKVEQIQQEQDISLAAALHASTSKKLEILLERLPLHMVNDNKEQPRCLSHTILRHTSMVK